MARRQLYEEIYGELFQTQSSEFPISQQKSRYLQQLANRLASIRTGRLDSSFDEFLQECWKFIIEKAYLDTESVAIWIFTHRHLIKGLLHAMVDNQPGLELFGRNSYKKPPFVKLIFLLRLFLLDSSTILAYPRSPDFSSLLQFGFQLLIEIIQSPKLMAVLGQHDVFWNGTGKLLEDLQELNQDEWDACLAAVLHKVVSQCVSKGSSNLQEAPLSFLLKLFRKPSFARRFLDSITLFPDSQGNTIDRSTLSTSLQIFEATYRATPMAMVNAYASKVTDPCTDSNIIRVECLELLEKLRSRSITNGICNCVWPAEAIGNMMTSVLYDSSVRVRRAAFRLLLKIEPPEVDEKELLYTVFLKTRDVDEKVKILAFQRLVRFPMKVLHSNLSSRDWKLLFQNALSHEGTQIHCIAKDFLFKYLSSDSVPPSRRLKALDYGKGENYIKYGNLMGNLIAEVFEMEVSFLDSYSCDDSYDEDHDVSA